jgi:preprotein translocase subunit YajC
MDFLISNAWAQQGAQGEPNALITFLPLIILFVLFYFLLIRPQMKRAKEHRQMVEALAEGDEIVTNGGVAGRITALGDNFIDVEIADKVTVKVQRQSVSSVLPKGTLKEA